MFQQNAQRAQCSQGLPSYACALAILFVLISILCQLRPIDDMDLFLQLRLGLDSLAQGKATAQNGLSYTLPDVSTSNPGWLARFIFSFLDKEFGLTGLRFFHSLLFAAGFCLAAYSAVIRLRHCARRPFPLALLSAGLSGFLVAATNSSVRPQSFAVLCFGAVMVLTARQKAGLVTLITTFFTGIVWSNTHPSLALGLLFCGCFFLETDHATRSVKVSLTAIKIFLVLCCSSLLSPESPIYSTTAGANFQISRLVLGISEWMPAWHSTVRGALLFFWLSIPVTLFLLLRRRPQVNNVYLAAALIFLSLSLYSARFALFYALVMIPVWANLYPEKGESSVTHQPALMFLPALLVVLTVSLPLYFGDSPVSKDIPLTAIEALKGRLPSGRIYNYREYAGPLVYFGNHGWTIKVDGRLYLYNESFWKTYYREASGKVAPEEIEKSDKPDAFFLHPAFDRGLIARLEESQLYNRIFADNLAAVYIKGQ